MEVHGLPIGEQKYGFTYNTSEATNIPARKSNLSKKAAYSQNSNGGYGIMNFDISILIFKAINL